MATIDKGAPLAFPGPGGGTVNACRCDPEGRVTVLVQRNIPFHDDYAACAKCGVFVSWVTNRRAGDAVPEPADAHTRLRGLSDRELRMMCGTATHQHYKGGLYRLLGLARDADTGEPVLGKDGRPRLVYEHLYPHERGLWLRDASEFYSTVEDEGQTVPRFRRLG